MRLEAKCVLLLATSALVWGQGPAPAPAPPPRNHEGPSHGGSHGPGGPGGKFWDDPEMVKRIGITAEQQKKMDDIWQQSRLKLIDLSATMEKEDVVMEGLMKGPQLEDSKILPAIDRIAQARAELEKANARLMLAIRHVLTPEQWGKMNEHGPRQARQVPGGPGPGMQGVPGGPGGMPGRGPGGPPRPQEEE